MPALNTDLLKKSKSLFSTTLSTGIGTGTSDTITPASVAGLPTDTAITITIDRVDSSGVATPAKLERITGVISGGNLTSYVRGVDGTTEQAHSGGAVIEMVWNADDLNDIVDWGLEEHNQDGTHKAITADSVTSTGAIEGASLELAAGAVVTEILDEDDMASDSATKLATQQSIKAYVDTEIAAIPSEPHTMSRQAIMNGNFDVWQRGTTVTNPSSLTFIADRYRIFSGMGTPPSTIVHSRQIITAGELPNSYYHYRINVDGAGTGAVNDYYYIRQSIENGTRNLAGNGKKVTLSFWAKSDIANKKIGVEIRQYYGTGGSPSTSETINGTNWTLTSSWTKYTHTFTTNTLSGKTFGTDNNDAILLDIWSVWNNTYDEWIGASTPETFVGSGTIDIAQVQLCAGDVALPFQPKSFAQELQDCMRYYEKSYNYGTAPGTASAPGYVYAQGYANVANGSNYAHIRYVVPKRSTAPTIMFYGFAGTAGVCSNAGGGTDLAAASAAGYSGSPTSNTSVTVYNNSGGAITPTGGGFIFHYTVSDEL